MIIILQVNLSMIDVDLPELDVVLSEHMMITRKRMFLYNFWHVNEKRVDIEI